MAPKQEPISDEQIEELREKMVGQFDEIRRQIEEDTGAVLGPDRDEENE